MQSIAARTLEALAHLPGDAAELGARLLSKLSPPQWQLEWYLPRWLGDSYGLPPELTDRLVLANVTGLLFICLQDKLADEGFPTPMLSAAVCLSTALQQQWIRAYHPLFEPSDRFWHEFEEVMRQWQHALVASNRMPDTDFQGVLAAEPGLLAHRAAPLKVCCAAAARLAKRTEVLTPLTATLDHLHVAAVLLDHANDWREDLEAGRYNAFVHFASATPQSLDQRELNRQRVYEELFLGSAGHAYFDPVFHHLDLARKQAAAAACPPLLAYLDGYHQDTLRARGALATAARRTLDAATQLVFGESLETEPHEYR